MGPTRPRPPTRWGPLRLLAAYGLGAVLISVPVNALGSGGPVGLSDRSLVALASGVGQGFALDRDGEVLRIGADGSVQPTTSLGHHSTPFGTSVAGRTVFGGTRCDGPGCEQRVGEVAVLDSTGRVDSTVVVARSSGWPSRLDGLALVGTDGDTVWVNGGGQLHQVAVGTAAGGGPAQVVDEVPWPGGEPCVVAGRLYDLAPSGGITGQQGAWLGTGPGAAAPRFRLRLRRWTGDRWSPVPGGTTSMPDGRNAYCTPTGYEIRDATGPHAEWTPAGGAWHPPAHPARTGLTAPPGPPTTARPAATGATGTGATTQATATRATGPTAPTAEVTAIRAPETVELAATGATGAEEPVALVRDGATVPARPAPGVSVSSRGHHLVTVDGAVVAVGADGAGRATGVRIPGFAASDMPPAVLVDDSGGGLLWCATTYRSGAGSTRCGLGSDPAPSAPGTRSLPLTAPGKASAATPAAGVSGQATVAGVAGVVDHYNLCSAACGAGVRGHSRDVVAWAVERDRPVALSLNEACYDDGVQLGGRLTGLVGGAGYSALDTAVGCPGAVKRFGNLVLVGGGVAPQGAAWGQFRTQADGPCDHRTDECRGMVCVDAGPAGQRRAFCSAHLESPRRAPGVAVDQAREYLSMVDARFGDDRARVLAGDFNLGRSDTDDVLGSAGYRAAGAGPSVGPRPSGGQEIDRIYDDGTGAAEAVGATYCDRQASDHCYLTTAPAPPAASSAPPASTADAA